MLHIWETQMVDLKHKNHDDPIHARSMKHVGGQILPSIQRILQTLHSRCRSYSWAVGISDWQNIYMGSSERKKTRLPTFQGQADRRTLLAHFDPDSSNSHYRCIVPWFGSHFISNPGWIKKPRTSNIVCQQILSGSTNNYTATKLEALAIVWECELFPHYLIGRLFLLYADHAPLTYW
jgi:hypothetical protein